MSEFKDLFSKQSQDYAKFRPHYPTDLFRYLVTISPQLNLAWDCGTGNGQAAQALTPYFSHIVATDPSEKQLAQASFHPKIEFRKATAEQSGIKDKSVDLITVAQAFHWFKQTEFFAEVKRVAKPGGVLAIWCYGLARITPEVDDLVKYFYDDILGSYWEMERKMVDDEYRNVHLPFPEIKPPPFTMTETWSLAHLMGYLHTWSALHTFIQKKGHNPLDDLYPKIKSAWGDIPVRPVVWNLTLRIGRI